MKTWTNTILLQYIPLACVIYRAHDRHRGHDHDRHHDHSRHCDRGSHSPHGVNDAQSHVDSICKNEASSPCSAHGQDADGKVNCAKDDEHGI